MSDSPSRTLAQDARDAGRVLARASTVQKDRALEAIAAELERSSEAILAANKHDLEQATQAGLSSAMLDRLALDPKRLAKMASSVREVMALPDPIGEVSETRQRPSGITVQRVRIPLGTILMIYEARPNATAEAAALCVKSGNAVILRGGKEALSSNLAVGAALRKGLEAAGLPAAAARVVETVDRSMLEQLLELDDLIDLCIPRGGQGLIDFVRERATMPVVRHAQGVCHVYLHRDADPELAVKITVNSKVPRPGVCNAAECLLVDRAAASSLLPKVGRALQESHVELRADAEAMAILEAAKIPAKAARPEDFGAEFLDLIMAVKVVEGVDAALEHIARYGTGHTEAIVTTDYATSRRFAREVTSAGVMVNVSTRLNDGGELGLGAEIGISTSKLHAYGPMGLRELTSQKYVVLGDGQLRA